MRGAQRAIIDAGFLRGEQQRAFGGTAAHVGVVDQLRVVAQRGDGERHPQWIVGADGPRDIVAPILAVTDVPHLGDHAVLGQRARLVRADHGRCPETLDRGQAAHQDTTPHEALHAEGECGRRNGRQAFGHRRDGERDGRAQHVEGRDAAEDSEREGGGTRAERDADEAPAQTIELTLERRRWRVRL
jgi:hypothetical protein